MFFWSSVYQLNCSIVEIIWDFFGHLLNLKTGREWGFGKLIFNTCWGSYAQEVMSLVQVIIQCCTKNRVIKCLLLVLQGASHQTKHVLSDTKQRLTEKCISCYTNMYWSWNWAGQNKTWFWEVVTFFILPDI